MYIRVSVCVHVCVKLNESLNMFNLCDNCWKWRQKKIWTKLLLFVPMQRQRIISYQFLFIDQLFIKHFSSVYDNIEFKLPFFIINIHAYMHTLSICWTIYFCSMQLLELMNRALSHFTRVSVCVRAIFSFETRVNDD